MITAATVDGININNTKRIITGIQGTTSANIDVASYVRGGRHGVSVSTPFYRSFGFSLSMVIIGTSFSDLVAERDIVMAIFGMRPGETTQKRLFSFTLSDGSIRQIYAVVTQISGDITPDTGNSLAIQIQAMSEKEYFQGADKTETIYIYNGGGSPIPMGIPTDMSVTTGAMVRSLTNSGNTASYPTVRVYGPMDSFDLVNDTTGESLGCTKALAASTNYIDFDFYSRTAVKDGTTNVLDGVSGTWWWLTPGSNEVKLSTTATSADAKAIFTYHDAYFGV